MADLRNGGPPEWRTQILGTASETESSYVSLGTSRNLSSLQAKYFRLIHYSAKYEVYSSLRVPKRGSDFFSEFQRLFGICVNSGVSDKLYAVINSIVNATLRL